MNAAIDGNVAKARRAWGENAPEWILALAEECDRTSQSRAAKRIGYSAPTVSQLLAGKYEGDLERVRELTEGLLLVEDVQCPVLGTISRADCTRWQTLPFGTSDSTRVRVFHACRRGCPNARQSLIERGNAQGNAA